MTRLLAVAVLALGMSACEFGDPLENFVLQLELEDVPVAIPAGQATVALAPNQTAAVNSTVTNDLDVAKVEELKAIEIKPEFLTFTPAAGKNGAAAASGTVELIVVFNRIPLPVISAEIQDNVVVSVSPQVLDPQNLKANPEQVEALLSLLPEGTRPALEASWESMTANQVVALINAGLAAESVPFAFVVRTTGDLSGDLTLSEFEIDARVSEQQD